MGQLNMQNSHILGASRTATETAERLMAMGVTVLSISISQCQPFIVVQPHSVLSRIGTKSTNKKKQVLPGQFVSYTAKYFEGCEVSWVTD